MRDQGHRSTAIGKLHYKSGDVDNGFSEEIVPLHILNGKGAVIALLRATPDGMPARKGHKEIYEKSGVGEADYQLYDQQITDKAVEWLEAHAEDQGNPWVLLVSYASPHPPFQVPQRFWDKYPRDQVPMPVQWRKADQSQHPATQYLSWMNSFSDEFEEDFVRRVIAGYCGLISVVDEHVGTVMSAVERLGLSGSTRVFYTSDHGEAAGNHGIMGKGNHYEHALNVPLLLSGPGVPAGSVSEQITSQVDLFPTIAEALGTEMMAEDATLPGVSLWSAITGEQKDDRHAFAEFHAMGALNAGFSLREGNHKLIYHVGMPRQLFDVVNDPLEENGLMAGAGFTDLADQLEAKLRRIVDPEAAEEQAKADQRAKIADLGGTDVVKNAGVFFRLTHSGQGSGDRKTGLARPAVQRS